MKVKARKVGNSITLTVPNRVAEEIGIYEGQEFEVESNYGSLEYKPTHKARPRTVDWKKYSTLLGLNITDGADPAEYIRRIRNDDRDPWK